MSFALIISLSVRLFWFCRGPSARLAWGAQMGVSWNNFVVVIKRPQLVPWFGTWRKPNVRSNGQQRLSNLSLFCKEGAREREWGGCVPQEVVSLYGRLIWLVDELVKIQAAQLVTRKQCTWLGHRLARCPWLTRKSTRGGSPVSKCMVSQFISFSSPSSPLRVLLFCSTGNPLGPCPRNFDRTHI